MCTSYSSSEFLASDLLNATKTRRQRKVCRICNNKKNNDLMKIKTFKAEIQELLKQNGSRDCSRSLLENNNKLFEWDMVTRTYCFAKNGVFTSCSGTENRGLRGSVKESKKVCPFSAIAYWPGRSLLTTKFVEVCWRRVTLSFPRNISSEPERDSEWILENQWEKGRSRSMEWSLRCGR